MTLPGCSSREFKSLMATLFLGAFNDNLFKTIVSILVLTHYVSEDQGILFLSLTAALFALPYILFSAFAGFLADRYSKTSNIKLLKVLELSVMLLAFLSFYHDIAAGLLVSVFLMGLQSALFSPSKYGILPELVPQRQLSRANGYTELYTFLAIIMGTALAGMVLELGMANPGTVSLFIAMVGIVTSLFVGKLKAANPDRYFTVDPFGPNIRRLISIKQDRALWLCILGSAYFYFIGTLFQLNVLVFAKQSLGVGELYTSLLLAALAIGIGIGSVLAGKASEGKVELGLVPLGGLGLCLLSLVLSVSAWSYLFTLILVFLLGISGGIFIVPINAYIQAHSPSDKLGGYLAASNFLTFCGIVVSAALFWVFCDLLVLSPNLVFVLMGVVSLVVSIYLIKLLPEMMARCLNWILLHIFYRMTKITRENVPAEGGALLVSNHVSFIDAQLILAALDRPVRFIMYRPIYEHPLINPIARLNRAIPIAGSDGKEHIEATLKFAAELIAQGELVGIFAEGKITRTGELNEFRAGLETIMSYVDAPIVPVCLKGVWGSIFSYEGGSSLFKLPKKIPYPLSIEFGKPLPGSTKATDVREVIALMGKEEVPGG